MRKRGFDQANDFKVDPYLLGIVAVYGRFEST